MIDEARIKENLREISFPRRFGTDLEKQAFNQIESKVKNMGLKTNRQIFSFTTFYSAISIKIYILMIFLVFILKQLYVADVYFIPISFVIIFISILLYIYTRQPEKIRLGKVLNSENMLVKLSSEGKKNKNSEKKKKIIFLAHVDSKGQTIPSGFRSWCVLVWVASIPTLIVLYFFREYTFPSIALIFHWIATPLFVIHLITGTILLFNFSNNKSLGALDNASGVVVILELLHYYSDKTNRPRNYDLWFLFLGAEEVGRLGMRVFLNELGKISVEKHLFLNFETIGRTADLVRFNDLNTHSKTFAKLIMKNSAKYDTIIKEKRAIIGYHTDSRICAKYKLQVLEFGDGFSYKYNHSKKDTIDMIDLNLLKKLCNIVVASVKELDQKSVNN
jgi:hypothetical protein